MPFTGVLSPPQDYFDDKDEQYFLDERAQSEQQKQMQHARRDLTSASSTSSSLAAEFGLGIAAAETLEDFGMVSQNSLGGLTLAQRQARLHRREIERHIEQYAAERAEMEARVRSLRQTVDISQDMGERLLSEHKLRDTVIAQLVGGVRKEEPR